MLPACSVGPVWNRYGVASVPAAVDWPVRTVALVYQPDGALIWRTQYRWSRFAPPGWVSPTVMLQSPSASDVQVKTGPPPVAAS